MLNVLAAVLHFQVKTGRLQTPHCNSGILFSCFSLVIECSWDRVQINMKSGSAGKFVIN